MDVGLGRLCGLFGKSRQAFYDRRWRSDTQKMEYDAILDLVLKYRKDGNFGVRTLLAMMEPDLAERKLKIGRDRLFDLLRVEDLLIRPRRRYKSTTNSNHSLRVWPNLVRDLVPHRSEQIWVSDITYIRTDKGFLYLNLVTDAYSKKVMGYHLSHSLSAKGTVAALRMALSQRQFPERELTHHSDRGIQYCSKNYVELLQEHQISISMTDKGSPEQNPVAERINRTFKEQFRMGQIFESYGQAMEHLLRVIAVYNYKRPHSSCSGLTPQAAHFTNEPLIRLWKNNK